MPKQKKEILPPSFGTTYHFFRIRLILTLLLVLFKVFLTRFFALFSALNSCCSIFNDLKFCRAFSFPLKVGLPIILLSFPLVKGVS